MLLEPQVTKQFAEQDALQLPHSFLQLPPHSLLHPLHPPVQPVQPPAQFEPHPFEHAEEHSFIQFPVQFPPHPLLHSELQLSVQAVVQEVVQSLHSGLYHAAAVPPQVTLQVPVHTLLQPVAAFVESFVAKLTLFKGTVFPCFKS